MPSLAQVSAISPTHFEQEVGHMRCAIPANTLSKKANLVTLSPIESSVISQWAAHPVFYYPATNQPRDPFLVPLPLGLSSFR